MKTVNDVLCFSNEIDSTDKLNNDCLEKLVEVKKMMLKEFEDYNISKKVYALNNIDEIKLTDVTEDLGHRLVRTESLRSVIFSLVSFKHLVDTNNKQEDKQ